MLCGCVLDVCSWEKEKLYMKASQSPHTALRWGWLKNLKPWFSCTFRIHIKSNTHTNTFTHMHSHINMCTNMNTPPLSLSHPIWNTNTLLQMAESEYFRYDRSKRHQISRTPSLLCATLFSVISDVHGTHLGVTQWCTHSSGLPSTPMHPCPSFELSRCLSPIFPPPLSCSGFHVYLFSIFSFSILIFHSLALSHTVHPSTGHVFVLSAFLFEFPEHKGLSYCTPQ